MEENTVLKVILKLKLVILTRVQVSTNWLTLVWIKSVFAFMISDTIYINTFTTLISVNCKWTPFGEWSECSKKCSGGTRQSVRRIAQKSLYGGTDCEGEVARIESCNENPCPSNV